MNVLRMLLASLLLAGSAASAGDAWHDHYQRGLDLLARGEARAARDELRAALAARPEEGLHLRAYGLRFVDYLPHLQLAIASHMLGDRKAAREELRLAERSGVAERSEAGATLLKAYRILLEEPAGDAPSATAPPPARHGSHEPARQTLAEPEFERLRAEVLNRCQVEAGTRPQEAPWYYHYELALELAARGDDRRAIDALAEATARRPRSQRWARTYGMWFLEYLPWWQLAQLHARNGDWECAGNALKLSEEMGEVGPQDKEYLELKRLESECAAQAGK